MALDNVEADIHGRFIERVGQLAQAAADAGDEAALAQFAALDEAATLRRAADLAPEAEQAAGRNLDAVEMAERPAQIVDLSGGQGAVFFARKPWP